MKLLGHYTLIGRSRVVLNLQHLKMKNKHITENTRRKFIGSSTMVINLTTHNPFLFHLCFYNHLCSLTTLKLPTILFTGSSYKQALITSILSYASGVSFSIWNFIGINCLPVLELVKELLLHCISCKLSKPRSHLILFPT